MTMKVWDTFSGEGTLHDIAGTKSVKVSYSYTLWLDVRERHGLNCNMPDAFGSIEVSGAITFSPDTDFTWAFDTSAQCRLADEQNRNFSIAFNQISVPTAKFSAHPSGDLFDLPPVS